MYMYIPSSKIISLSQALPWMVFFIQITLNFAWPLIFFVGHQLLGVSFVALFKSRDAFLIKSSILIVINALAVFILSMCGSEYYIYQLRIISSGFL